MRQMLIKCFKTRKLRRNKNKYSVPLFTLVFLLFSMWCFSIATESLMILKSPDSIIVERESEFEFSVIKGYRNTGYVITLDDGNKLSLDPGIVDDNKFVNLNKCEFRYSKWINIHGRHKCVSISADGIEFLNERAINKELKLGIFGFYLIALIYFVVFLFFNFVANADIIIFGIKKHKKMKELKRKKKLKEMQAQNQ